MNLAAGAGSAIVSKIHTERGNPKDMPESALPLAAARRTSLIVVEVAAIAPTENGSAIGEIG